MTKSNCYTSIRTRAFSSYRLVETRFTIFEFLITQEAPSSTAVRHGSRFYFNRITGTDTSATSRGRIGIVTYNYVRAIHRGNSGVYSSSVGRVNFREGSPFADPREQKRMAAGWVTLGGAVGLNGIHTDGR